MSKYAFIQEVTREIRGFTPRLCWIADVLAEMGLAKSRVAVRKYPCPPHKREDIRDVIIALGIKE